ncbi:hypothetical protein LMG28690_07163 [Paraburkholderia caffeinilytica]|nr:hypothetical protein LMG28690_07163 [Paraburkholderia caffeinilytica]
MCLTQELARSLVPLPRHAILHLTEGLLSEFLLRYRDLGITRRIAAIHQSSKRLGVVLDPLLLGRVQLAVVKVYGFIGLNICQINNPNINATIAVVTIQ